MSSANQLFDSSSEEEDDDIGRSVPAKKRVIDDDDDDDDDDDEEKQFDTSTSKNKSSNAEKVDQDLKDKQPDEDKMDVDDDDDGDDEKKDGNKKRPPGEADSDDDDDESEKKKVSKETSSKPTLENLFEDSEDDDDDNVFDDKGAIVGSSAPASSKKPKPAMEPQSKSQGSDDDGDEDEGGGDGYRNVGQNNMTMAEAEFRSQVVHKAPSKATIPDVDRPGTGQSLHYLKLPNVLGVQPACFDEDQYDQDAETSKYMVRWRYKRDDQGQLVRGADGKLVRESNAKLVKWSDGSFTIHIGKEAFDIPGSKKKSDDAPGDIGYVYLSHQAEFTETNSTVDVDDGDEGETKTEKLALDCIGSFSSRFVPKVSSLQSDAHKSLAVAIRSRTIKKARIGTVITEEDPEHVKQARAKSKQDEQKLQSRKTANRSTSRRTPGMNRSYLEDGDEEGYDTTNIRALKKKSNFDDDDAMNDYGDDSDDSDGATFGRGRPRKRPRKAVDEESDDDGEEEMVFDDDDDDEEEMNVHAKKKQTAAKAVWDDDE